MGTQPLAPLSTNHLKQVEEARKLLVGRCAEAEIRDILKSVVKPAQRIRMGDALARIGRSAGLTDAEVEHIRVSCIRFVAITYHAVLTNFLFHSRAVGRRIR